ncbi:TetR/AcrR family transcriptional regulator [Conexibacter woesei]|uniref:Transcriptional regulator, TetR family n=1 Tax=Conexibacter woesei (strain DSM 14684 / CCUG 47730 / CIP 108061 / JCM 11494 / NBRC 100937 / ID131577) TaxID=469383 RepID=D3F3R1_CONWI|nr:TetR/AcrR family transcriptional regulator [Conexibacter woesei]ADB52426.1 transcriptional regulator, TetR family [Conexibacter woesei DSM 14684]
MLAEAPHIERIIAKDPASLWTSIRPDSSRRLLLAALDAFGTLGFEGATTREIATRAKMSPAAVYVHYGAKIDLLETILEVAHQAAWEAVSEALDGVVGPSRRLRVFAEAFAAWHASNYMLGRVAQYELPALPEGRMEKIAAIRRGFERLVRHELRLGIDEEGFIVPDLDGTALVIVSLGIDLVRWYSPDRRITVEELARLRGELVLRMVRPWGTAAD